MSYEGGFSYLITIFCKMVFVYLGALENIAN